MEQGMGQLPGLQSGPVGCNGGTSSTTSLFTCQFPGGGSQTTMSTAKMCTTSGQSIVCNQFGAGFAGSCTSGGCAISCSAGAVNSSFGCQFPGGGQLNPASQFEICN